MKGFKEIVKFGIKEVLPIAGDVASIADLVIGSVTLAKVSKCNTKLDTVGSSMISISNSIGTISADIDDFRAEVATDFALTGTVPCNVQNGGTPHYVTSLTGIAAANANKSQPVENVYVAPTPTPTPAPKKKEEVVEEAPVVEDKTEVVGPDVIEQLLAAINQQAQTQKDTANALADLNAEIGELKSKVNTLEGAQAKAVTPPKTSSSSSSKGSSNSSKGSSK